MSQRFPPRAANAMEIPHRSVFLACNCDNELFRDLTSRHRGLADIKRTDLRCKCGGTIVSNFLVADRALGLLFKRKLESGVHDNMLSMMFRNFLELRYLI